MTRQRGLLLVGGIVAALAVGLVASPPRAATWPTLATDGQDSTRKTDEDAIRKASGELAAALQKGDAKALGSLWTEEGEFIADGGATIHGRAAIEKAYAKHLADFPKRNVELTIDSIRFVSRDSAIEEGHARSQKSKADQAASNRYSVLRVRENGQWFIALLREWPDDGITLSDMDWLIGTWAAKTDDGEIRSTYEWDESKNFIRCRFSAKIKDEALSGMQMIGRDPRTGNLRSWLFESEGGFGDAEWSWDGKHWVLKASGVQADGSEMTATNIMTPLDKDSFTWQSIDRTEDGENLPNIPPIKVTRVK
jgi:uncharacterized protein (TIGR02246 family)